MPTVKYPWPDWFLYGLHVNTSHFIEQLFICLYFLQSGCIMMLLLQVKNKQLVICICRNYRPCFVNALSYFIFFKFSFQGSGWDVEHFFGGYNLHMRDVRLQFFISYKSEIRKRNVLVCIMVFSIVTVTVPWTFEKCCYFFAQLWTNRQCFLHSLNDNNHSAFFPQKALIGFLQLKCTWQGFPTHFHGML